MSNRTLFASTVVSALCATTVHAAEPTDDDRAAAQEAFGRAMSERARGDLVASLASFEHAHARLPSPITGLELGRAYMLVGRLVDARRAFDAVVHSPAKSTESSIAKQARSEASSLEADVSARLPRVAIEIAGARDVELAIDGVAVRPVSIDGPHELDPGRHHVTATHGGLTSDRTIDLKEAERRTVKFIFGPGDVSSHDVASVEPESHAPTWAYGALIVGGVGVGIGSIAGVVALSDRSSLGCHAGACSGSQSDIDGLNRATTIATLSFVVGLAGIGLGAYGLLTGLSRSEQPKSASVEPWIGFGSIGLSGTF